MGYAPPPLQAVLATARARMTRVHDGKEQVTRPEIEPIHDQILEGLLEIGFTQQHRSDQPAVQ